MKIFAEILLNIFESHLPQTFLSFHSVPGSTDRVQNSIPGIWWFAESWTLKTSLCICISGGTQVLFYSFIVWFTRCVHLWPSINFFQIQTYQGSLDKKPSALVHLNTFPILIFESIIISSKPVSITSSPSGSWGPVLIGPMFEWAPVRVFKLPIYFHLKWPKMTFRKKIFKNSSLNSSSGDARLDTSSHFHCVIVKILFI